MVRSAPFQAWQMARASASAASAGVGSSSKTEHTGDHGAHLALVCGAITGDRGLHLARSVKADGKPAARRRVQRDATGLCGAHHRAEIVLGEDALDRDGIRREGKDRILDPGADRPGGARASGCSGGVRIDADMNEDRAAVGLDVHASRSHSGSIRGRSRARGASPGQSRGAFGERARRLPRGRCLLFVELRLHVGGNLEVREDVLHVVACPRARRSGGTPCAPSRRRPRR